MKKLIIIAMLIAMPAIADECINDFILFQQGPDDFQCGLDVMPYLNYELQLIAKFNGHLDPISHLEFKVINPLVTPYYPDGLVEWYWGGYSVSGNFATGLTIEFDPPLDPGTNEIVLATLSFMSFNPSWPDTDHVMHVEDPAVYDIYGQAFYTTRGFYTFNPTSFTDCMLAGDYETMDEHAEAISPPQGATVLGMFDLNFTTVAWLCMPESPIPFVCEVIMDGNLVDTFEGEGTQPLLVPLDASGYNPGDEITLDIFVHSHESSHATIHYIVEEPVPVRSTDFSSLKTLY
jgi:hypothetical protein